MGEIEISENRFAVFNRDQLVVDVFDSPDMGKVFPQV